MSSVTSHVPPTTPIERKRQKRRLPNPVVLFSCVLLLGKIYAAESKRSATTITPALASPRNLAFLRTTVSTNMPTRSGIRYSLRGGAATGSDSESYDSESPEKSAPEATIVTSKVPPVEGSDVSALPNEPSTTSVSADTATTTATAATKQSFSWRDARKTLFPIDGKDEVHKFFLIGFIKFFIIMALTLTRDTKDTLIVTQCGAEAIAFLKVSIRNVFDAFKCFLEITSITGPKMHAPFVLGERRILFGLNCLSTHPIFFIVNVSIDIWSAPCRNGLHCSIL